MKFGSELVAPGAELSQERIDGYVDGLLKKHNDADLAIVTSGAVALGRDYLPQDAPLAAYASVGNPKLMAAWQSAFEKVGRRAGEVLITDKELDESTLGLNSLQDVIVQCREYGVVPLINENDVLSNKELMQLLVGGDNDGLAAHIASNLGAHSLWLFTERGGIVDDDGKLITDIDSENTAPIQQMLRSRAATGSGTGRGGIMSKFEAARRFAAASSQSPAYIAAPDRDMSGSNVTVFHPLSRSATCY